ncbi:hypothetical protein SAMN05446935_10328 [Burkholderia sp. YR290]|jgi:hypothetical protein|nr:hypothetical protein SAMN05446934_6324 [Paraburkholderia hospita]SOE90999.1 hypothetical protein SAMN05446935_10328 [Burkholderia sp. YR290]
MLGNPPLVKAFTRKSLIVFLAIIAGVAQSAVPTGWYIFRAVNAGTIDGSGWTNAHSEDGKFSIRTPGLYSDRTVWSTPTGEAPVISAESIMARSPDGVTISAARIQYNAPTVARTLFDKHEIEPIANTDSSRHNLRLLGFEAVDDIRHDSKAGVVVIERRILDGSELFLLVAVGPSNAQTEDTALTAFGSLQIEDSSPLVVGIPPAAALPIPSNSKQ